MNSHKKFPRKPDMMGIFNEYGATEDETFLWNWVHQKHFHGTDMRINGKGELDVF